MDKVPERYLCDVCVDVRELLQSCNVQRAPCIGLACRLQRSASKPARNAGRNGAKTKRLCGVPPWSARNTPNGAASGCAADGALHPLIRRPRSSLARCPARPQYVGGLAVDAVGRVDRELAVLHLVHARRAVVVVILQPSKDLGGKR